MHLKESMARPFTHDPRTTSFSDGLSAGPCGWHKMTSLSRNKRRVPYVYYVITRELEKVYTQSPKLCSCLSWFDLSTHRFPFSLLNISQLNNNSNFNYKHNLFPPPLFQAGWSPFRGKWKSAEGSSTGRGKRKRINKFTATATQNAAAIVESKKS